ncbi:hypothetical protein MPSEU_000153900 [Mayamaea pseudoterrestris]|nr:hypothetical protein MPSEU_000153900 [Mayamaea pseudoterrestris]
MRVMRSSYSLGLIAFMATFAYGFSVTPSRLEALRVGKSLVSNQSSIGNNGRVNSSVLSQSRGGGLSLAKNNPIAVESKCPVTGLAAVFSSLWGTFGVVYILAKAIRRVLPIALEPFQAGVVPLTQVQLGIYIATCLWFAYVEGYKGFQTKFAPLVVKRSFTLVPGRNGTKWYHFIFAPTYTMGMLHATRKRKIVSFSVTLGVAAIVAGVKRLPYPWRNIIDAGVVAGLSWGSLSIIIIYVKSWVTGQPPTQVDAALPLKKDV